MLMKQIYISATRWIIKKRTKNLMEPLLLNNRLSIRTNQIIETAMLCKTYFCNKMYNRIKTWKSYGTFALR